MTDRAVLDLSVGAGLVLDGAEWSIRSAARTSQPETRARLPPNSIRFFNFSRRSSSRRTVIPTT